MKKLIKFLFTFFVSFVFISTVNAANVNFTVSSSANQVIVGKPVTVSVTISSNAPIGSYEYTLNYDNSIFKCTDAGVGLNYAGVVNNNKTYSVSFKYVFVAQKSGTGKFYVDSSNAFDFNEGLMSPVNGSKSVKAITYAEYEASLSKNNNLKSLSVEGYEIDPEFNKDTLEYTVQVKEDETKVKIIATPEDGSASVTGAGEVDVSSGSNTFDIVVVAENGSEKTYKITIDVIDKEPIEVNLDDNKYTVVKVKSNLIAPTGFTETTVNIKGFDIPAFTNDVVNFTLVGLKDTEGNISLFIYEDDKYTKYIELNFGNLVIYPLTMEKEVKGYTKSKITIKNEEVECLESSDDSRFKLIYGHNIETNEKGLYLYDAKDNVAIKYDDSMAKIYQDKINLYFYLTVGFALSTLITLITLISVSSKKDKNKIKKKKNKETEQENIADTKEEQLKEDEISKIEIASDTKETLDEEVYDIFEKPKKKKKR